MTMDRASITDDRFTLAETLPSIGLLLLGVPTLTVLVMSAVRYVANGSI
ncbi:MAG TPA: hypothetical protein VEC57_09865 [Candidatus Limnocylindrales bacterium]|nr:hypothetical protein [Candidatus Limnocylindrales bacterium]